MKQYKVAKKDSLWRIARANSTTVDKIADLNGLKGRQLHMLKIDQIINIPENNDVSIDTRLSLQFCALDFSPVKPKSVRVIYDNREETHVLDEKNLLSLAICDHSRGLTICIEDPSNKMYEIFKTDRIPLGEWKLSLDSRKIKSSGNTQPKRGEAITNKASTREAVTHNAALTGGATQHQQTRIEGGEPVHGVGTIYTKSNLRLTSGNEKYRRFIISAAEKYNHAPQSIAAWIDAEARLTNGAWDEKSNYNNQQRAKGIAQFLPGAWTEVYQDKESLLYNHCRNLSPEQRLDKRFQAVYAIDGVASYATSNLRKFDKRTGFSTSSLPPDERAKVAYLLHHEGVDGVLRLVNLAPQMTSSDLRSKLAGQLGRTNVQRFRSIMQQYNDDPRLAYEGWLYSYVDSKIRVSHFTVSNIANINSKIRGTAEILKSLVPSISLPNPNLKPLAATQPSPTEQPVSPQIVERQEANGDSRWRDPLDVCTLRTRGLSSGKIGATFGRVRNNFTTNHQGIDLEAVPGTPIYAVADGTVYPARTGGDYGDTLILVVNIEDLPSQQANEFRRVNPDPRITTIGFFYAHLKKIPEQRRTVNCGDLIGETGSSGNARGMETIATGAHLHFEVRKLALGASSRGLGNRADPLPFIINCTNR